MFQGASAFNQPLSFDTSRVTDMSDMFHGATSYDQPLSFDTSHVMNMAEMFAQASAFNKPIQCTSRRACSFISGATGHRNRPLFRS